MTNNVLENRRLWIEALKNQSVKGVGQLENKAGALDFIGVACALFIPETRSIIRGEVHFDGNYSSAPEAIIEILGLNPDYNPEKGYVYLCEYYHDIYSLHDESDISFIELAEILEDDESGFFLKV